VSRRRRRKQSEGTERRRRARLESKEVLPGLFRCDLLEEEGR